MPLQDLITRQLRGDEGAKPCVYRDTLGYLSIGVGRLVDGRKSGAGLRPSEIDFMLANDIADRLAQLSRRLPWFDRLDDARKGALLNMAFQLGIEGLTAFTNTLALVQRGNYAGAAHEMLDSTWAKQTPLRAQRLAKQMATGVWQFEDGK
jgi:lysozyme